MTAAMATAGDLELFDEQHGSEYFVIDKSVQPPVWYRMDGSVFAGEADSANIRSPEEILTFINSIGGGS